MARCPIYGCPVELRRGENFCPTHTLRYEKRCSNGCGKLLRTDVEDERQMCTICFEKKPKAERFEIISAINRQKLAALDVL